MDASGPASKRRKLGEGREAVSTHDIHVKEEEPDSPPPQPQRRLVTSGSQRYPVIPADCRKNQPGFKEARSVWSKQEAEALKALGLRPVRVFIRDDGMVIDWTSVIPVWNDTLRRAKSSAPSRTAHDQGSAKPPKPAPPDAGAAKTVSPMATVPKPPRLSALGVRAATTPSGSTTMPQIPSPNKEPGRDRVRQLDDPNTHRKSPATVPAETVTPLQSAQSPAEEGIIYTDADADVEEMYIGALEFLEKFIATFDEDRSDLASAYSCNAVFSYRLHEPAPGDANSMPTASGADKFASRPANRDTPASNIALTVKQSRVDIVGALLSLSSVYKLLGDGNTNFKYDMSYLDAKKGLLLICYAEIVDPQRNHRLLLDQSFVLRRKEQDKDDNSNEGLWPIVAVCHQMTIRDMAQFPAQDSTKRLRA